MSIERFIWKSTDVIRPLCWECKHLQAGGKCKAFPNGIPEEFLSGDEQHTEPHPNDNGIQFEKVDEQAL